MSDPEHVNGPRAVLLNRQVVCENQKFSVFFDDLLWPGREGVNYLVVAPKQRADHLITGVAVLPVVENKFGLIRIYRHAIQGDSWEIPRGFIENGESPPGAALRELQEETGLSCSLSEIGFLGSVTPDAGILAARVQVYVASDCSRRSQFVPGELGHREFRLFDKTEMGDLISTAEIQDPCTMIAYYKFLHTTNCGQKRFST